MEEFIYKMIARVREKEELDDVIEILGVLQAEELIDVGTEIVDMLDSKADDLELKERYLGCQ